MKKNNKAGLNLNRRIENDDLLNPLRPGGWLKAYFTVSMSVSAIASVLAAPWILTACGGASSSLGSSAATIGSSTGGSQSGGSTTPGMVGDVVDVAGVRGVGARSGLTNVLATISNNITSMKADSGRNLYFFDNGAVRKLSPQGVISTLAGASGTLGYQDGYISPRTGLSSSLFNNTAGIDVDQFGNIYVADGANNSSPGTGTLTLGPGNGALRRVTPSGVTSTVAYYSVWSSSVLQVAVDSLGTVASVLDITNSKLYRVDLLTGSIYQPEIDYNNVWTSPASPLALSFTTYAVGQVTDNNGNVLFLDNWQGGAVNSLSGYSVDTVSWGPGTRSSLPGNGGLTVINVIPNTATSGVFNNNLVGGGLTVDGNNTIFVTDTANYKIATLTRSSSGVVTQGTLRTSGNQGYANGLLSSATFNSLGVIASDYSNNLFLTDNVASASGPDNDYGIRKINLSSSTVTDVVLTPSAGAAATVDGISIDPFQSPIGIVQDTSIGNSWSGNFFVLDSKNLLVSQIASGSNVLSPFAGLLGVQATSIVSTGGALNPVFIAPVGISTDGQGNFYVADAGNPATSIPSFVVQIYATGSNNRQGVAGTLQLVSGQVVAITSDANNTYFVDDTGALSFIANSNFSSAAGGASATPISLTMVGASFNFSASGGVGGMTVDGLGNLFVSDTALRKIFKVSSLDLIAGTGQVIPVAGGSGISGSQENTANALSARFSSPTAITYDTSANRLYVADGSLIVKVAPWISNSNKGSVQFIAGGQAPSFSSTPGSGSANANGSYAGFTNPKGLTMGQDGYLYVADTGNSLIRRVKVK